jgi:hypothetical protein
VAVASLLGILRLQSHTIRSTGVGIQDVCRQ